MAPWRTLGAQAALTEDRAELARLRARHASTGNPLFCWRAVEIAIDASEPLPPWVLTYLANVAVALVQLAALERLETRRGRRNPGRLARAVMRALGFKGGRGPGTAFSRYNSFERGAIAYAVHLRVVAGSKVLHAADDVAAEFKVSSSHVLRCWRERRGDRETPDERTGDRSRGARTRCQRIDFDLEKGSDYLKPEPLTVARRGPSQ